MAHPYTTRERVRRASRKADTISDLLDSNQDGVEDTEGAVTYIVDAIDEAADVVDARLGARYIVPFAGIADTTPTPSLITRVTNWLVLSDLYFAYDPRSPEGKYWLGKADGMLTAIIDNVFVIETPGVSAEDNVRRPIKFESAGTWAAGRVDDDYSADGVNKTRGM